MPGFDRWLRSRTGWTLANLFYEKCTELPEITEVASWRILFAVQQAREAAKLAEKFVDIQAHYDPKGSHTIDRFREWAEIVVPAMAIEKKEEEKRIKKQLESISNLGPLSIQPVAMPSFQAMRYAQELHRKTL